MLIDSNNRGDKTMTYKEVEQGIKDEGWTRRKELVRAGEYSDEVRTVTVSEDGRFTIYPSGSMRDIKIQERGGGHWRGWMWAGYSLRDAETERAREAGEEIDWLSQVLTCGTSTVGGLKKAVARFRNS